MTEEREPYQQRALDEKEELDKKILALKNFAESPAFEATKETQQKLLVDQYEVMQLYSEVLDRRIKDFDFKN